MRCILAENENKRRLCTQIHPTLHTSVFYVIILTKAQRQKARRKTIRPSEVYTESLAFYKGRKTKNIR